MTVQHFMLNCVHLCEQYLLILAGQDVGHTQVGQDHSAHIQDLQWDTQTHTNTHILS